MFIMIKPGIYMDAKRCLKVYKCISEFMDRIFSWQDEINSKPKKNQTNIVKEVSPISEEKNFLANNDNIFQNVLKCSHNQIENEDELKQIVDKNTSLSRK